MKRFKNLDNVYPAIMTRDQKITFLAGGVIDGWYGDEKIQKRILGDHYQEVKNKVNDILN